MLPCREIMKKVAMDVPPTTWPIGLLMHEPPGLPKACLPVSWLEQTRDPLPVNIPWKLPSGKEVPQPATDPAVPMQVSGSKPGSAHADAGPFNTAFTNPAGVETLDTLPQIEPLGPSHKCCGIMGMLPMFCSK